MRKILLNRTFRAPDGSTPPIPPAITLVEAFGGSPGGFADTTYNIVATLEENDFIIIFGASDQADGSTPLYVSDGYTFLYEGPNTLPSVRCWYKKMTATPDTTIRLDDWGNSVWSVAYRGVILRGVNTTTPIDVTTVANISDTESGTFTANAITTATDGAALVFFGGMDDQDGFTVSSYPTDYTEARGTQSSSDGASSATVASCVWLNSGAAGLKSAVSMVTNGFDHVKTIHVALRPA